MASRDELWWVLLAITKQKTVDYVRHETARKRGSGQVQSEVGVAASQGCPAFTLDELISHEPTAEMLVILQEQHFMLLSLLRDDLLRQIAQLRIESYSSSEIADTINLSKGSVERKLQLVRKTWARELDDAPE